ncbi:phosphatidate cytidylyltransferase [Xanthobacter sp. TB0139]|uniref:phosphatidate cytidylyltransferase n=1 Tax=Xanthobacter sp. TB0139 TaxID=3459178 RepID=UPI004039215D
MSGSIMNKGRGGDLKYRAASVAVLVPVVLALTWLGGWAFTTLWLLASVAVLYEWASITCLQRRPVWLGVGVVCLLAAAILLQLGQLHFSILVILAGALVSSLLAPSQRGWAFWGIVIAGATLVPVVALRGSGLLGMLAIFYLYAVVWATDSFAYFTGRTLGGPKLWPRVSPNKTWSGALGGVLAGALAAAVLALGAGLPGVGALVGLAVLLSIVSQAGDLAESSIKRLFGVKDAGCLIPGHGGILDRLDGFIVAALLALVVALLRGGMEPAAGLMMW